MKVKVKTKLANQTIVDEYDITNPFKWRLISRVIRERTRYGKVTVYVKV